jgi:Mg2+ and Co2+ transporter CorA
MATLSFNDDLSRRQIFQSQTAYTPATDSTQIQTFEWSRRSSEGIDIPLEHARDLTSRPGCGLRIIVAPLDIGNSTRSEDVLYLFDRYNIPSQFVSERLQSVAHSFGTKTTEAGIQSWLHFLCKNISTERDPNDPNRVEIKNPVIKPDGIAKNQSQADFSWIRSSYFLQVKPDQRSAESRDREVTLVCFGPPNSLVQRFSQLKTAAWTQALEDPYILLDIVLDELYLVLDGMSWALGEVFGGMEARILNRAVFPGLAAEKVDFVGLHNVAKHVIYLRESAEALSHTVEAMVAAHAQSQSTPQAEWPHRVKETSRALTYRKGILHSTNLRLKSMEERMKNIIQLSFNLVTQQDSRSFQVDNKLMKLIALVTLVFLPTTALASIFGSQFFLFNTDGANGVVNAGSFPDLKVSRQFWVFWVLTIPLTGFLLVTAYWYFKRVQAETMGKRQPRRTTTGLSLSELEKGGGNGNGKS